MRTREKERAKGVSGGLERGSVVAKQGAIIFPTQFFRSGALSLSLSLFTGARKPFSRIPRGPSSRRRFPSRRAAAEPMQIKASNKFRYRSPGWLSTSPIQQRRARKWTGRGWGGLPQPFSFSKSRSFRGAFHVALASLFIRGLNSQTLADPLGLVKKDSLSVFSLRPHLLARSKEVRGLH